MMNLGVMGSGGLGMMLKLEERLKGIGKCWMYLFLREYNVRGTVERSGSTNPLGYPYSGA